MGGGVDINFEVYRYDYVERCFMGTENISPKLQKFSAKEDEHTDIHCVASWRYKYEKQTWNLSMLTLFYILQVTGQNKA